MKVFADEREMRTAGGLTLSDITQEVEEAVAASDVTDGLACVFTPHTTCSIRINEWESGIFQDFTDIAKTLVPQDRYYAHDDWERRTENLEPKEEFPNGPAHCTAMLIGGASETIPIRDGSLCLGAWQHIIFVELDRERDRRWVVQVIGE
jgi:secondary thiamine-phosphate synthase enzyme